MAAYDLTTGGVALSGRFEGGLYIMEKEVDFTLRGMVVSDTLALIDIPADTLVMSAGVECLTVQGATATADFGDATDPNGWADAVNLNSAGNNLGAGVYVVAGGKLYTAATPLLLTADHTLSVGKARAWVVAFDVSNRKLAQHKA